jgi:serine O-acetyltransferase
MIADSRGRLTEYEYRVVPSISLTGRDARTAVTFEAQRLVCSWIPEIETIFEFDVAAAIGRVADRAVADLRAYADRDPASGGDWRYVLAAYRCYRAVLAYRIAHSIMTERPSENEPAGTDALRRRIARRISERSAADSGVEIHPAARIGERFVVDHGIGTVIGETAAIGDDCYLLQGVVLGSKRIADNPARQRHPTLGNRVEVGAFARVLGAVTVGDDAVIGCHALVVDDLPNGARVNVVPQQQVMFTAHSRLES